MNPAYINSNRDEANIITMNNKCEDRKHTNSGISYQLRNIWSICRWNIAAYKWKVHNGKFEIIIDSELNLDKHGWDIMIRGPTMCDRC
jgi:hypothetical protein